MCPESSESDVTSDPIEKTAKIKKVKVKTKSKFYLIFYFQFSYAKSTL